MQDLCTMTCLNSDSILLTVKQSHMYMIDFPHVKALSPNLFFCFQLQEKDGIIVLRVMKCQNQLCL